MLYVIFFIIVQFFKSFTVLSLLDWVRSFLRAVTVFPAASFNSIWSLMPCFCVFISVQLLSCVWLFATPWTLCRPPCPSPTPRARSDSCPSSWWCHPTISSSVIPFSCLQSSQYQDLFQWVFTSGGQYSGLISFRMDWFDLLAVQGTFKNLLQYHNLKASILQLWTFFMVQLSHPYMTTGKTIGLAMWTFVDKVMSLLFNMLSRFVIAFHPRSKCLLISWLQSLPAVILEPKKAVCHCFYFSPLLFALKWWDWIYHSLSLCWVFKPACSLSFHPHQEVL